MIRACVELHGFKGQKESLNGKRGIVLSSSSKTATIQLATRQVSVDKKQMCVVFCLGLPRETLIIVKDEDVEASLDAAIKSIDEQKFVVLHARYVSEIGHRFLRVRREFFSMAMQRMRACKREPLLRVYVADYSQTDPGAKILFQDEMLNPLLDEYEMHMFADLTADEVQLLCTSKPDNAAWERHRSAQIVRESYTSERLRPGRHHGRRGLFDVGRSVLAPPRGL